MLVEPATQPVCPFPRSSLVRCGHGARHHFRRLRWAVSSHRGEASERRRRAPASARASESSGSTHVNVAVAAVGEAGHLAAAHGAPRPRHTLCEAVVPNRLRRVLRQHGLTRRDSACVSAGQCPGEGQGSGGRAVKNSCRYCCAISLFTWRTRETPPAAGVGLPKKRRRDGACLLHHPLRVRLSPSRPPAATAEVHPSEGEECEREEGGFVPQGKQPKDALALKSLTAHHLGRRRLLRRRRLLGRERRLWLGRAKFNRWRARPHAAGEGDGLRRSGRHEDGVGSAVQVPAGGGRSGQLLGEQAARDGVAERCL